MNYPVKKAGATESDFFAKKCWNEVSPPSPPEPTSNVGLYENLKEKIFPVEIAETPLSWEYRNIAVETAGLLLSSFTKESESFVVGRTSFLFCF